MKYKKELEEKGFSVENTVFSEEELDSFIDIIENSHKKYAIRQLVNFKPQLLDLVFKNRQFVSLYQSVCDENYFLSKAIFFNKPSQSNWFVGYHQDMSISVKNKVEKDGYTNWTSKNGQLGVIPPKEVLENTITFRIHLDNTDETNGALKVIPKTHTKGFIRIDENFEKENLGEEYLCNVKKGGVMLMKPLLLHASAKSTSEFDRRVIHLEFCNKEIPMNWLERKEICY
ncbi:phytanoyl-CoA dioxygenase family protein [Tenacibaculum sp. M341]|uniref:phytanoyl-CoA dioxygenase family protein n=1 Tax=Tenacibaculum sp. M341 TaxID=2530339 RepID=UPI00104A7C64|nr:phytanoyl-CoA dioxygenase family protein [Tenacibaculum sp. M341]TCI90757.1 phytanoyl-CoA dioxygenase [Tenacibaculum sp. M341]